MNLKATLSWSHRLSLLVLMMLSVTLYTGCENENDDDPVTCNTVDEAGELVEATFQLSFTPAQVEPYFALFGAPLGFSLTHSADAYKIHYKTRDINGDLVLASGVMFVPQGVETLDLVSVQHGTALKRENTGSVNPLYAMDGIMFAMSGFMANMIPSMA